MSQLAPHAHKVTVRDVTTGQTMEVWPVDAREMVRQEDKKYEYVTKEVIASPVAASDSTKSHVESRISAREQLEQKSYVELQELAKRIGGISANQKRSALIDQIIPHVTPGAVTLEKIPDLVLPHASLPNAEV